MNYTEGFAGHNEAGFEDGLLRQSLRSELVPLGLLLVVDLLIGLLVAWRVPFKSPTSEYLYPALEFAEKHRIASDFLPVGLSGLAGVGAMWPRQTMGLTAVCMAISLGMVVAAWAYLRALGVGVRATFVLTALLSVYPDFLLSYNKLQDVNLTALFLFGLMAAMLWVLRSGPQGRGRMGAADVMLAMLLGLAVTVRTNLVLMLPLAWFLVWKFRVPGARVRSVAYLVGVALMYVAVTTALHGRPFLPHNGPYNLYAGANELTGQYLNNEEDSLPPALARHGIYAQPMRWTKAANQPGIVDLRDHAMEPVFDGLAKQFVETHPGTMVKLAGLKLYALLRPDLRQHGARSVGGLIKMVAALAFPLWVVGMVWWRHPEPVFGMPAGRWMIALMVVLYLLPFMVTVSPPRFGVPLAFVCWMDLGAMVVVRYGARLRARG